MSTASTASSQSTKKRKSKSASAADAAAAVYAAKKQRFKEKMAAGGMDLQRMMAERGKIKYVNQQLKLSGLKKLIANNCVIVGDGNHVVGNDNVMFGVGNTADGDNNKFVKPPVAAPVEPPRLSSSVSRALAANIEREVETPRPTIPARPPPPEPELEQSRTYLTLPDNWCALNGVILYDQRDIEVMRKWHDDNVRFRGRRIPMPRATNCDASYILGFPADMLDLVGRRNIPTIVDQAAVARTISDALAFGRIPLPYGMPPSTTTPRPFLQSSDALNLDPPPQSSATPSARRPEFLPEAGVNPDANQWKVSLLDLPGDASPAGKGDPTCKICMTNLVDVLFEPCHHLQYCRECARGIYKANPDNPRCPTCRATIKFGTVIFAGT